MSTKFWKAFDKVYPPLSNTFVGNRLHTVRAQGNAEEFGIELHRLAASPYEEVLDKLAELAARKPSRTSLTELQPLFRDLVELAPGWDLYQLWKKERADQGLLRSSTR